MAKIKFCKELAASYRTQGMNSKEIAAVMGCSVEWVNKAVAGLPKGMSLVEVDGTKMKAIEMVKDLLKKLEEI